MAALLRRMGIARPRIAVLSATESELPAMPSSIEGAEIAAAASAADGQADFAGPLSFDLAVSPLSASIKGIEGDSPRGRVAGHADAVVVPDIVAGNVLFKSIVYFAGGLAAGVVLGGRVPIILTSRSDPPAARLASLVLAAIAGQEEQE
jgi:phosphate acetyltransferase